MEVSLRCGHGAEFASRVLWQIRQQTERTKRNGHTLLMIGGTPFMCPWLARFLERSAVEQEQPSSLVHPMASSVLSAGDDVP
eukprot:1715808-Amphidinium_carterae.1